MPIQQQVTGELVDILDAVAQHASNHHELYQTSLTKYCAQLAQVSQQSNLAGALQQALDGTNCCHTINHYVQGLTRTADKAFQQFQTALHYLQPILEEYALLIEQHAAQGAITAQGLEIIVTAGMLAAPTATASRGGAWRRRPRQTRVTGPVHQQSVGQVGRRCHVLLPSVPAAGGVCTAVQAGLVAVMWMWGGQPICWSLPCTGCAASQATVASFWPPLSSSSCCQQACRNEVLQADWAVYQPSVCGRKGLVLPKFRLLQRQVCVRERLVWANHQNMRLQALVLAACGM